MKIGDKIQFDYLKEQVKDNSAGWNNELVDYSATSESYTGTVVEVRDIIEHPVSQETIQRNNIKGSHLSRWNWTTVISKVSTMVGWLERKFYLRPKWDCSEKWLRLFKGNPKTRCPIKAFVAPSGDRIGRTI